MTISGTPSRAISTAWRGAAGAVEAGAPAHHDQAAQPAAEHAVAGAAHDGDDLLDRRWVCRIVQPFVARRAAGMKVRQRGG
jgi:hypothetical protein